MASLRQRQVNSDKRVGAKQVKRARRQRSNVCSLEGRMVCLQAWKIPGRLMWRLKVSVAQTDARDKRWSQIIWWACTCDMIKFMFLKETHNSQKQNFFFRVHKSDTPLLKYLHNALESIPKFSTWLARLYLTWRLSTYPISPYISPHFVHHLLAKWAWNIPSHSLFRALIFFFIRVYLSQTENNVRKQDLKCSSSYLIFLLLILFSLILILLHLLCFS